MADTVTGKRRKSTNTGVRRMVLSAAAKDAEAQQMIAEIEAAAKRDRRELGDFLMVELLKLRADGEKWFGVVPEAQPATLAE